MKFSIVIPTYNRANFIERTLKSVLNQSYKNFEILIIDNCSTDNTFEIIEKYLDDERIKFIQNEQNFERSYSRNKGLEAATGEYLTFLDSDDVMSETCIEDAYLFATQNSSISIFHNLYQIIDQKGKKIAKFELKVNYNNALKSILKGNFLGCIGVFLKKDIYSKYRFNLNPEVIGSEDWLFWLEIINETKELGYINKVNSFVTEHDNRTENNRNPFDFEKQSLFIYNYVNTNFNLTRDNDETFKYSIFLLIAVEFCDAKMKKKSIAYLIQALKLNVFNIFKIKTIVLLKNLILR